MDSTFLRKNAGKCNFTIFTTILYNLLYILVFWWWYPKSEKHLLGDQCVFYCISIIKFIDYRTLWYFNDKIITQILTEVMEDNHLQNNWVHYIVQLEDGWWRVTTPLHTLIILRGWVVEGYYTLLPHYKELHWWYLLKIYDLFRKTKFYKKKL